MGIRSTLTVTRTPVVSAHDAERALHTALWRGGEWSEIVWERHGTLRPNERIAIGGA